MNKRYRELEKKANDTRCTYEKLVKKSNILQQSINIANADKINAFENAQVLEEELNVVEKLHDFENIMPILECASTLQEYGDSFLEDALKKVNSYTEIFESKNNLLNETIVECEKLKEEIEMDEATFKFQWNKNRKLVSESMAMSAIKNSKKKNKEYNKLCKKSFDLLADRDKAREQAGKLDVKVDRYMKLREKHNDMLDAYCTSKGITYDEFNVHKMIVLEAINNVIHANRKVISTIDLISEYQKELDNIVSKLEIAKDKMEEAEYQFKEYKHMANVA